MKNYWLEKGFPNVNEKFFLIPLLPADKAKMVLLLSTFGVKY